MSPVRLLVFLGAALLAAIAGGCGRSDGWQRMPVTGRVTLDGQPLETGRLTLFPIDGTKGPAAGTEIKGGVFTLSTADGPVAGKHRVEIRSVQKTGRQVPSPSAVEGDGVFAEGTLVEEYADVIPTRYNTYSELEFEVRSSGPNEATFSLFSADRPGNTP
jgi:hypothetical protein